MKTTGFRRGMDAVEIAGRRIGLGRPCFVIAEAGVNHNGDLCRALEMIDVAADAGADAVKFQTFSTAAIANRNAPKAPYHERTTDRRESQFEMLSRLELSEDAHRRLVEHCGERQILFLTTPYDAGSADLMERLDAPAYKIASTDTTNLPLLRHIARKERPVLLSTGMCSLGEVDEAVTAVRSTGNRGLVLMQCTAQYPTPLDEVNLKVIPRFAQLFDCPVGFSDHTSGIEVAGWAVAIGACLVEKHFTLSRTLHGPDHAASLEPEGLRDLIRVIRTAEVALGDGVKRVMPCELSTKPVLQKSVVAARDLKAGNVISEADLTCKRPGTGLPPSALTRCVGLMTAHDIPADTPLAWWMLRDPQPNSA